MTPLDAYSPDYKTARVRFRSLIAERGWDAEAIPIDVPGYAPDDLTIDVARVGSPNAERLLVLTSGLHGAEGLFGSAVQLAWLASLPRHWEPPAGFAVLLIHALNPHGVAEVHRANEDNVDLNRNFLSEDEFARLRETTARDYGPFDGYLNPACSPSRIDWFPPLFLWMALRYGFGTLQRILPAGQYEFSKGIFHGGSALAQSTKIVMNEMPRWVGAARFVIHFDYHTGLGKFGDFKLLASDPAGSKQVNLARRLFGDLVVPDHETEGGYHNFGDMGEWLSRRFADLNYLYLCAEFGTYGSTRVIGTLRRDNQARHWTPPESPLRAMTRAEMLEVFVPSSHGWRWAVVQKSVRLIQSSLTLCAEWGNGDE
ncbi:MAG: DUF2817 domain-containing protein [Planctomycetes bacterium]|nr:DUF2817 domain-containing protein [Planctomycetota bacterium]